MNIRRIIVLLRKELEHGTRSFIVVFAMVIPVVMSLVVSLVFGRLFAQSPRIGIIDHGASGVVALFTAKDYLETTLYTDEAALRRDVERGSLDMGIVLPAGFDDAVRSSTNSDITILFWGESQTSNRAMLVTALANAIVSVTEREVPVTVEPVQLGSGEIASWSERLLPLLVLMSIVLGGTLIPAVSLVDEKQRRTLLALTTTPATLYDVLTAKAMLGIGVSLVMGVVILTLNRAFGSNPLMLVSVLGLGASTASIFGILLGTLVKDMNGLFTVIKSMAMLLYAPAIIEIIPQIPQWIAQFFPTYYLIAPIQAIALDGAQWSDVGGQVAVLVLLTLALLAVLVLSITRQQKRTAYAV